MVPARGAFLQQNAPVLGASLRGVVWGWDKDSLTAIGAMYRQNIWCSYIKILAGLSGLCIINVEKMDRICISMFSTIAQMYSIPHQQLII